MKDIYQTQDEKENAEIIRLFGLYGEKWSRIAKELGDNRTDNYCKRIVFQYLRKNKKTSKFLLGSAGLAGDISPSN